MKTKSKAYDFLQAENVLDEICELSRIGFNETQIAKWYGIAPSVFDKLVKRDKKIRHRIERGELEGLKLAMTKLQDQVQSGNSSAIIFYLKVKAKWLNNLENERIQQEKSKKPIPKLTLVTTDPNEAARIYQEIMQGD